MVNDDKKVSKIVTEKSLNGLGIVNEKSLNGGIKSNRMATERSLYCHGKVAE